jgi:hypothetical protein
VEPILRIGAGGSVIGLGKVSGYLPRYCTCVMMEKIVFLVLF